MKIPKQAKKVFTGEIFDIYQWPQKMFDGSTATFEMISRVDTVQIIATKGNKIIMGNEVQPGMKRGLSLLGGRCDADEPSLKAAKRELKEESGLASKNWKLIHRYHPLIKMDWEMFLYIARDCQIVSKPHLDAGEKIDLVEISFEEFVDFFTSDFRRSWLSYYLTKLKAEKKLSEFKKILFGK
ncbi:MAG: NUDIX hydrolase [Candidatus Magasanikbacteria bacterium]|nr:NUDIX hydrolase [Candidatus Magasanikbacteria bacterium]